MKRKTAFWLLLWAWVVSIAAGLLIVFNCDHLHPNLEVQVLQGAVSLIIALIAGLFIFEVAESDRGGVLAAFDRFKDWLDEKEA